MVVMEQDRTHPVVERINAVAEEQGVSRTELARRLGWDRMQVVRRLAGGKYATDLTVPELEAIAAALDVPLADLLPPVTDPDLGLRRVAGGAA